MLVIAFLISLLVDPVFSDVSATVETIVSELSSFFCTLQEQLSLSYIVEQGEELFTFEDVDVFDIFSASTEYVKELFEIVEDGLSEIKESVLAHTSSQDTQDELYSMNNITALDGSTLSFAKMSLGVADYEQSFVNIPRARLFPTREHFPLLYIPLTGAMRERFDVFDVVLPSETALSLTVSSIATGTARTYPAIFPLSQQPTGALRFDQIPDPRFYTEVRELHRGSDVLILVDQSSSQLPARRRRLRYAAEAFLNSLSEEIFVKIAYIGERAAPLSPTGDTGSRRWIPTRLGNYRHKLTSLLQERTVANLGGLCTIGGVMEAVESYMPILQAISTRSTLLVITSGVAVPAAMTATRLAAIRDNFAYATILYFPQDYEVYFHETSEPTLDSAQSLRDEYFFEVSPPATPGHTRFGAFSIDEPDGAVVKHEPLAAVAESYMYNLAKFAAANNLELCAKDLQVFSKCDPYWLWPDALRGAFQAANALDAPLPRDSRPVNFPEQVRSCVGQGAVSLLQTGTLEVASRIDASLVVFEEGISDASAALRDLSAMWENLHANIQSFCDNFELQCTHPAARRAEARTPLAAKIDSLHRNLANDGDYSENFRRIVQEPFPTRFPFLGYDEVYTRRLFEPAFSNFRDTQGSVSLARSGIFNDATLCALSMPIVLEKNASVAATEYFGVVSTILNLENLFMYMNAYGYTEGRLPSSFYSFPTFIPRLLKTGSLFLTDHMTRFGFNLPSLNADLILKQCVYNNIPNKRGHSAAPADEPSFVSDKIFAPLFYETPPVNIWRRDDSNYFPPNEQMQKIYTYLSENAAAAQPYIEYEEYYLFHSILDADAQVHISATTISASEQKILSIDRPSGGTTAASVVFLGELSALPSLWSAATNAANTPIFYLSPSYLWPRALVKSDAATLEAASTAINTWADGDSAGCEYFLTDASMLQNEVAFQRLLLGTWEETAALAATGADVLFFTSYHSRLSHTMPGLALDPTIWPLLSFESRSYTTQKNISVIVTPLFTMPLVKVVDGVGNRFPLCQQVIMKVAFAARGGGAALTYGHIAALFSFERLAALLTMEAPLRVYLLDEDTVVLSLSNGRDVLRDAPSLVRNRVQKLYEFEPLLCLDLLQVGFLEEIETINIKETRVYNAVRVAKAVMSGASGLGAAPAVMSLSPTDLSFCRTEAAYAAVPGTNMFVVALAGPCPSVTGLDPALTVWEAEQDINATENILLRQGTRAADFDLTVGEESIKAKTTKLEVSSLNLKLATPHMFELCVLLTGALLSLLRIVVRCTRVVSAMETHIFAGS
eukprot:gnl/Chilomastix_cuspidata/1639.p1 GENE.gnl/Chilomastix_cuspidata/1639~~gnl/Chilomastix_cuspidata/1639.p1  ORF type:complete len:1299 (+),score=620.95 gnl/Chilomastix_cuspidata/1639:566-4462(+)